VNDIGAGIERAQFPRAKQARDILAFAGLIPVGT
jgi:hypothetical protein